MPCAGKENGPSAGGVLGPLPGLCAGGGPAQLMMWVCNPPTPLNYVLRGQAPPRRSGLAQSGCPYRHDFGWQRNGLSVSGKELRPLRKVPGEDYPTQT